jgi:hypothetical protein
MGMARIQKGVRQMRFEGLLDRQTRGEITLSNHVPDGTKGSACAIGKRGIPKKKFPGCTATTPQTRTAPKPRYPNPACRVRAIGNPPEAGGSQKSAGQCLKQRSWSAPDLQKPARACDRDRPWLHRLRNLAHEVDMQESVLQARALDLDIIDELEATPEGLAH